MPGSTDENALAARRARRAAIRLHHPDAGGSAAALIAALSATGCTEPPPMVFATTARSRLRRLGSRLRLALRRRRFVIHDHEFIENHEGTTS
ncbi:hypothetical protein [Mycolicibacterium arseniciresistens]|jgi:hypothetical protein|uniref:Uncharacterized protein n=1 Tax=Mycolicibacterium arseniciresistens TaxID=3062257 RepID=A0ABT8UQT9_9MYCO|nr:hypothetical protein [Mycolicibacterium arseniciresistens]MDO3639195.1 hypothetical protein [Mycolicibacterium arseniciresistens]